MRVLLVGDYADDARLGSGKVYHKLREELGALGHEVEVLLSPALGPWPANARLRWAAGPWVAARAVARAWKERGPFDVIDAASAEGLAVGLAMRAGAYRGAALVARSHGLEHLNFRRMVDDHRAGLVAKPWTRRLWYPLARMSQVAGAARVAHRLIVLNEGDRAFAVSRGWLPAERVEVVPHGVSARFLEGAPPPDAPRGAGVLFCGTWDTVKGVQYLVRAWSRLAESGEAPRLTVLGAGAPEEAVLAAFPPPVRPLVTVLPRVPEEEVMRRYREHDLLVFPSTYEGFGMVVVEALSQRLPVVASAVGCAPSLLAGGAGGPLVPPRDADALAEAVRRMMGDAELRRRAAETGFERVRGMTWRATAERTVEVYRRARGEARANPPASG